MEKTSENKPKNEAYAFTMQRMVGFATEFGFVIALPVVVFGLGGRWLDGRTHHEYLFTLVGILLALITSVTFLARRISIIRKDLLATSVARNKQNEQ